MGRPAGKPSLAAAGTAHRPGAPHLYFIPILFQCYLLYPLLRRWVNRAPVQSAAWALMVTFLLQGGYLLHDLELLPFSLPAHLWMLFPT
ncbi:MAG: acyltransferase family protein [Evtepia gabavorous]